MQTVWDRDRGVQCKQHGIAIEVCSANNMGSRSRCAMQTTCDRDRGVPCKQHGIATEVCVQTTWDHDRGMPCKQHGIAIEVCHANNMGSLLRCAVQTVCDRDRCVLCK